MENALKYAKMVIDCGQYELLTNFADLWDINNQGNKEVIFSVQFTTDPVYRGVAIPSTYIGGLGMKINRV